MAQVGNLGSLIVFEVSGSRVLTFDEMRRTVKGRWAAHAVIGSRPVSEYLGPDRQSVTFSVFVTAAHGISPRKTIERIEKAVESGTPYTFVIGGQRVGSNQWIIESVSEAWGGIIENGKLLSAHLNISLSEYV